MSNLTDKMRELLIMDEPGHDNCSDEGETSSSEDDSEYEDSQDDV